MSDSSLALLTESEIVALVRRIDLLPQLVRRQQEELIVEQVPLPADWLQEQRHDFLGDQDLVEFLESVIGLSLILIFIFVVLRPYVVLPNNALGLV